MPFDVDSVLNGSCRVSHHWRGLAIDYAWLPPFDGAAPTRPNRIEVVFSAHSRVSVEHVGRTHEIAVEPGGMFIVGAVGTTLLNVGEYSETLEMYPDQSILRTAAEWRGIRDFEWEPTLQTQRSVLFERDATVLSAAHILRRVCMGGMTLSDIEASSIAELLAQRILTIQYGCEPRRPRSAGPRLGAPALRRIEEYVEANLCEHIALGDLARVVHLSPFHFARCFKGSTGLAPHMYVLARRIDRAKSLVMTTPMSVQDIAHSIGYDNLSHFRRQFAAHIGTAPGDLRRATASYPQP